MQQRPDMRVRRILLSSLCRTATMPIPEPVKKAWVEIQQRYAHPVNAFGMKISDKDAKTLDVWKTEGIDQHVKKD